MRRIIILTGNGKGKTTSAIGAAVRALGRGFKVYFYQFIKSKDVDYGEHLFFKPVARGGKHTLKIVRLGYGCRKDFKYGEKDAKAAIQGLKKIYKETSSNPKMLVVLDEVTYPIIYKWFTTDDIVRLIKKNPKTNFILTGRNMPKKLITIADTVSCVEEIKHAYKKGCKAVSGVEF
ncbi:MAG: cob(I)yrinic acid a,c-diamide adenosyltransferase [Pseudomonadota bacterium]